MPQLEQLQFFFSQAFWLAFVFFFIYAFVSCFFIPRIGSIVEMRHEKIKTDLSLAEKLAKEQGEITSKIENILEKARSKSSEVKLAATKNAENFTNESINKFEKELARKTSQDEEKLYRFKIQLEGEAGKIAQNLSKEIFQVIVKNYGKSIN